MRYLDAELARVGASPSAWADEHLGSRSYLKRWREGTDPSLELIARIAEALGRPVTEVVLAAFGEAPVLPKIGDALDRDDTLTDAERAALRGVLDAMRATAAGLAQGPTTVEVSIDTPRRVSRKRHRP